MCAFPISLSNPRLGQRRRRQPRLRQAAINPAKARKVARRASVAVPGCSILLSWAGKQHSALEHAHVLSAGLEKPLPRPGISLEELEQLLSYLPAAGFTGMHVIVGPHVLQRPDEAVRLAWPVAARPQIRSPQGDRRLHLAARGIVVQQRVALDLALQEPANGKTAFIRVRLRAAGSRLGPTSVGATRSEERRVGK